MVLEGTWPPKPKEEHHSRNSVIVSVSEKSLQSRGCEGERRKGGGTRESKRQARENTQAKRYNSLRGARRKHAIDSVLKPPTNNSH